VRGIDDLLTTIAVCDPGAEVGCRSESMTVDGVFKRRVVPATPSDDGAIVIN
jgi:hypothetical protein